MNELDVISEQSLSALVDRAAATLASARSSAEVLEARDLASLAYATAKRAGRLAKMKKAHDELIAAAYHAQADALEIESMAKAKLADEYDEAQDHGEVAKHGQRQDLSDGKVLPTAADIGLTHKQVHDARQIRDAEEADPGVVRRTLDDCLERGEEPSKAALNKTVLDTILRAANRIRRQKKEQRKTKRKQEVADKALEIPPVSDRYTLHNAPCIAALDLKPGSVDWIITDPPYPKEFLPVYDDLARIAMHVLKPGGSLLCMTGHSWLPEVISLLGKHLTYHWTLAYLTPGGQAVQIFPRRVNTFWKPVLWFVKGGYAGSWVGDVTRSDPNDNDKRFHHWGQSESGMADLMSRFVQPGDTVLDPFMGGGTTGSVALALGSSFVGFDSDADHFHQAVTRLYDVRQVA